MWAQIQDPFPNCLKLLCSCGSGIESTSHSFLDCPLFNDKRHTLLNTLNNIDCEILEWTDSYLTQTLLYGCSSFDTETNTLNVTIEYFLSTERFEGSIFQKNCLEEISLGLLYFIIIRYYLFVLLYFVLTSTLDFQCLVIVFFLFIMLYSLVIFILKKPKPLSHSSYILRIEKYWEY